jgi:hypothetical protein
MGKNRNKNKQKASPQKQAKQNDTSTGVSQEELKEDASSNANSVVPDVTTATPTKEDDADLEFSTPMTSQKVEIDLTELAFGTTDENRNEMEQLETHEATTLDTTASSKENKSMESSSTAAAQSEQQVHSVQQPKSGGMHTKIITTNASALVAPAVLSAEPTTSPWTLYHSPEGYPYYYNAITGESQWAEVDAKVGATVEEGSIDNSDDSDDGNETSSDSSSDIEYSSSSEDSDSESSEYDSLEDSADDAELGYGLRHANTAASADRETLTGDTEAEFQRYLDSPEGRLDLEREQARIQRRIERKFALKTRREQKRLANSAPSNSRLKKTDGALAGDDNNTSKKRIKSRGNNKKGKIVAPLDAITATVGSLFGGLFTLGATVSAKAAMYADNYWKGKSLTRDKKYRDKKHQLNETNKSIKVKETDYSDSSDSDDIASIVSSDDSDVQEIQTPLIPEWATIHNVQSKVGNKINSVLVSYGLDERTDVLRDEAVTMTRKVAERSLESAEWVLEKTGQSVTIVGGYLFQKINTIVADLVTKLGNNDQITANGEQATTTTSTGKKNKSKTSHSTEVAAPPPPFGAPPGFPIPVESSSNDELPAPPLVPEVEI